MNSYFNYKKIIIYTLTLIYAVIEVLIFNTNIAKPVINPFSSYIQIYDKKYLKNEIESIYNKRSSAFVTGNLKSIEPIFDTSQKYGKLALGHEVKRVKYLKHWAKERDIRFTNVHSSVRIKNSFYNVKTIKINLEESYKFDYIYTNDVNSITNSFGVGIRHTLNLIRKNNKWLICSDHYTDCFEDALQAYTGDINENITTLKNLKILHNDFKEHFFDTYKNEKKFSYNRKKAAEYADKYCGAAWGSKNNFNYNKKYNDFNGIGGDCTNFASQVLSDSDAGGIPMDNTWKCENLKLGNLQCSVAWINANGLKNYLINSNKGIIIQVGTFKDLTTPVLHYPNGEVEKLQLADLICYEKKGHIDHFAVVTSWDSRGYPLINSHTTDRYHVPWDLGWSDNKIRFFLIHINDNMYF